MARSDVERSDWWRWALGLAVVVAGVVAVIAFDRSSRPEPAEPASATTIWVPTTAADEPGVVDEDLDVPAGMTGTLYTLGDDETLIELDLATGRSRTSDLTFEVEPWFVNQVVALEEVVLVTTRRQVFAIDRATLSEQVAVMADRWVVAPPSGEWAALVPYGASGTGRDPVVLLDGRGQPVGDTALTVPSGVAVEGAVDQGLVVDAAGSLEVVALDGRPPVPLPAGRFVAGGNQAIARMVCESVQCAVHAGTLAQPDAVTLPAVELAGDWLVGGRGVFDAAGEHLAIVAAGAGPGGDRADVVAVFDVTPGANTATPAVAPGPASPAGVIPALAFSSDGGTLIHTSDDQLVLWRYGDAASNAAPAALTFDGRLLAVTVTDIPPPPPPQSSGPPPSFL